MNKELKEPVVKTAYDRRTLWSFFDNSNPKHRYIISLCHQYGWVKDHPVSGKSVADLGRLDRWLKGRSKKGKSPVAAPIKDMTPQELTKVITALENMVKGQFDGTLKSKS